MNRPSHWILVFLAAALAWLWLSGRIATIARADHTGSPSATGPLIVRPGAGAAGSRLAPEPAAGRIAGRVLDRFGWPIAGADVELLGPDANTRVVCDPDGRFELAADVTCSHSLWVSAKSYRARTARVPPAPAAAAAAAGPARLVVTLEDALPWDLPAAAPEVPRATLHGEGFVRDERGAPGAFAIVSVRETGAAVRADDTGRFRVPLPAAGGAATTLTLVAQSVDHRVAAAEVGTFERRTGLVPLPDLVLRSGARVHGLVKDDAGQPAPDACVELVDPTAAAAGTGAGPGWVQGVTTDAHGAFTFAGVLEGDYELRVLATRGGLSRAVPLRVERDVELDVGLEPERPLRLRVVDQGRAPQPHVHVVATGSQPPAHAQADAAGEAVLRGLGAGPYQFEVRAPETHAPLEVVTFEPEPAQLVVR